MSPMTAEKPKSSVTGGPKERTIEAVAGTQAHMVVSQRLGRWGRRVYVQDSLGYTVSSYVKIKTTAESKHLTVFLVVQNSLK